MDANPSNNEALRVVLLIAIFLAIVIPTSIIPLFGEKPVRVVCPNPRPDEWISAAQYITNPIGEREVSELIISGTAMEIEAVRNIEADLKDIIFWGRLIGGGTLALFAPFVIQSIFFRKRDVVIDINVLRKIIGTDTEK